MSFDKPNSELIAEASEPTPPSGQSTLVSQKTSGDQLLRSNAIVALGTGLSRLTGMLRVIVFGVVIGQTALADAYDGANNSPNAVYELLLGGVLSAALVPMFTRMLEDDDRDSAEAVVGTAIVALTFITAIAVFFAPWVFRAFSLNPADGIDANQFRTVGTALTRIFLLQIFFYGVSAVLGSLLNAQRRMVTTLGQHRHYLFASLYSDFVTPPR
jgi:putative peptidoglycan lipid II flippase